MATPIRTHGATGSLKRKCVAAAIAAVNTTLINTKVPTDMLPPVLANRCRSNAGRGRNRRNSMSTGLIEL